MVSVRDVGGEGYPILVPIWSFFWECEYEERTAARLRDFWTLAIGDGQENALTYGYAPAFQSGVDGVSDAADRIGRLD